MGSLALWLFAVFLFSCPLVGVVVVVVVAVIVVVVTVVVAVERCC